MPSWLVVHVSFRCATQSECAPQVSGSMSTAGRRGWSVVNAGNETHTAVKEKINPKGHIIITTGRMKGKVFLFLVTNTCLIFFEGLWFLRFTWHIWKKIIGQFLINIKLLKSCVLHVVLEVYRWSTTYTNDNQIRRRCLISCSSLLRVLTGDMAEWPWLNWEETI